MPVVVRRRQAEAAEQVAPLRRTFILQVWRRRASFAEDERNFRDHEIERWFVCHSPLLALTVATTSGGELSPPMELFAEDERNFQPGWSWMNGYNQKRQLQRSSGLASFYVLPFVNDKAAQLQQLAIHSYVSCLNVSTIMKNLCLNINALFSVFFCENTMIILSTINKLCTRQGSSTVWQFCNLQDQVMTMLWFVSCDTPLKHKSLHAYIHNHSNRKIKKAWLHFS